jgi:triacylglycerol lipase
MLGAGIVATLAVASASAVPAGSYSYPSPRISPPGANDFSCKPTRAHPEPVVLVHGTFGDMTISWNLIAPALEARGYCVFALDYGRRATAPIAKSARELKAFVNRVQRATGASEVSIVGHSQGGMMPRYYIKFLHGARHVDDLVGLAPSNHGTTNPGAPIVAGGCPACAEQEAGSSFLRHLNHGDETPGRVDYTVVETSHDEVVTPYRSAFLAPGPRTTNVLLQRDCPLDSVDHNLIIYDPVAVEWIENALARRGPANPAFKPTCAP